MNTVLLLALLPCVAPQDAEAIDALIARLSDAKRARTAVERLILVGKPAVKPLLAALGEKGKDVPRARILAVLGRLGPAGAGAIDFLAKYVKKAPNDLLTHAVRAIADIAPFTADDSVVKRVPFTHTILVLRTRFREKAKANAVAVEVHRFMLRRSFDVSASVDKLIEHVQQNKIFIREIAAEALGHRGAKATAAVDALAAGLDSKDEKPVGWDWHHPMFGRSAVVVRDDFARCAADALIRIAPEDPRSVSAWTFRLGNSHDVRTRVAAVRTLGKFGAGAESAVNALARAALGDSLRVVRAAVRALGEIGNRARSALPTLKQLSKHADAKVRREAARAIERIQ